MKTAYFDCFAGISGDMTLGALVDAGAHFDSLKNELAKLNLGDEYDITVEKVTRRGISATDVTVELRGHHHGHGHHGRGYSDIIRVISESDLSETVKARASSIFKRLGEAEAKIHGVSIDEIHFHEVGAVDAILDITGACICSELLGIERVIASPVPTFHGTVRIAHGTFPLPAPATVELLKGAPWRELGVEGEIVTPTGAAILAEFATDFGPLPPMTVDSIGYGAGKKDFGVPNVLRVMIGESVNHHAGDEVAVLETNVDDISPQVYDVVMERLFAIGALDVYFTPIHMKKNRPAVLISVLCKPHDISKMSDVLFEETSTIGIRIDNRTRICLPREIVTVQTNFGPIRVKVARRAGEVVNYQPEFDDCRSAATMHGVSVKRVRDAAVAAFLTL